MRFAKDRVLAPHGPSPGQATQAWGADTGGCLCVWPEELFGIGSFHHGAERGLVSVMFIDISYLLVHLAYIRGEKKLVFMIALLRVKLRNKSELMSKISQRPADVSVRKGAWH